MLAKWLSELWCNLLHDSPTWPIHGRYQCRQRGRLIQVPWTKPDERLKHTCISAWQQALEER